MLIKVACPCGQAYEFDAEPSDGKMPVEVQCPGCGKDGTELANEYIASQTAAAAPRVRILDQTPARAPAVPNDPVESLPRRFSQHSDGPNLPLGIAGGVGGALLGMIAWFLLIKWTGYEIGYAAWGVGVLTGLGARKLARGGSQLLGVVAGVSALVAIIGGQYLAVKSQFDTHMEPIIVGAYDSRMTFARSALKAQTDEELRVVLARTDAEEGKAPNPAAVTAAQIAGFRENEIPRLQTFVDGSPTRSEYEARIRSQLNSSGIQGELLKESLGLFTLLWLFLGISSAFRIARHTE